MNAMSSNPQPLAKTISIKLPVGVIAALFLFGLLIVSALTLVPLSIVQREAIHTAARKGDVQKVARILDKSPERIEARNRSGCTPLLEAAMDGQTEVLELLIRRGANVNANWDLAASGNSGWNALHVASNWGHIEAACVLIRAGVDINGKTEKGQTPLDLAFFNGYTELANLLQAHGAIWGIAR